MGSRHALHRIVVYDLLTIIHQDMEGIDLLLSLMRKTHDPCHCDQTDSHSRCERKPLGVSRCLDRLPEDQRRPDCSRLSYGVHDHESKCSLVDIVFEDIICPATAQKQNMSAKSSVFHRRWMGDEKEKQTCQPLTKEQKTWQQPNKTCCTRKTLQPWGHPKPAR